MYDPIESLESQGFACVNDVFSSTDIQAITDALDTLLSDKSPHFRTRREVFAIRCLLDVCPALRSLLLIPAVKKLVQQVQSGAWLAKAIYFNKPPQANWVVNWHQDLTVNVRQKADVVGFANWTRKDDYFAVHPPVSYLHQTVTLRIHLDACDATNGALQVVPGSHDCIRHIRDVEAGFFDHSVCCEVPAGGVMLMKPLLWHSSRRSENDRPRRVIHLEFCAQQLPEPLEWHEHRPLY